MGAAAALAPTHPVAAGALALSVAAAATPSVATRTIPSLRNHLFTRINGDQGIRVPGDQFGSSDFEALYRHADADGRAQGAAPSDVFWYAMAPSAHLHQENVERGPVYKDVRQASARMLAMGASDIAELVDRACSRWLDPHAAGAWGRVRLTEWFLPAYSAVMYEMVFGVEPDARFVRLATEHAGEFLASLKALRPRDLDARRRFTGVLEAELHRHGTTHDKGFLADRDPRCIALYLQGNFFMTGIVQLSEAAAHTVLALAQHPEVEGQTRGRLADDAWLNAVLSETFRLFPLFGVAHRITSADITLEDGRQIAAGSVLCFDHEAYARREAAGGSTFDPARWLAEDAPMSIAFGVRENRPCPAERFSMHALRATLRHVVPRYAFVAEVSHTRSMADFAPAWVFPAEGSRNPGWRRRAMARVADSLGGMRRSVRQLVYGTQMASAATAESPCAVWFQEPRSECDAPAPPVRPASTGCPFGYGKRANHA